MKKNKKITFISFVALTGLGAITSLTSCGHSSNPNPGGDKEFNVFSKLADKDGASTLKANGINGDYWGNVAFDEKEVTDKINQYLSVSNIDNQGKVKVGFNGTIEQTFGLDQSNTIVLIHMKAAAGDDSQKIMTNSEFLFNSWNKKDYDQYNWQPDYEDVNATKFLSDVSTDQTNLVKYYGSYLAENGGTKDAPAMQYHGITKFDRFYDNDKKITLDINSFYNSTSAIVDINYNFTMDGLDNGAKIAALDFSFIANKNWTPISIENLNKKSLTVTAKSSIDSNEIKKEFNQFLASKDQSKNNTFLNNWLIGIETFRKDGKTLNTIQASSLTVDHVTDKGVIVMKVVATDPNRPKSYTLETQPLIANGFSAVSDPTKSFIRFSNANYNFEQGQNFSNDNMTVSLKNILKLHSINY